jgi:hypothetical protein
MKLLTLVVSQWVCHFQSLTEVLLKKNSTNAPAYIGIIHNQKNVCCIGPWPLLFVTYAHV